MLPDGSTPGAPAFPAKRPHTGCADALAGCRRRRRQDAPAARPAPLWLLLILAAVLACAQPAADDPAARPPNVVFILADDLGYGDLGAYGSTIIDTPHIDALAASGVRFEAGYVTAAVCSPSRAGLMTGRYPQRHGYEFNGMGRAFGLSLDETTLAEVMGSAGYATGAVGKWQLGWEGGMHPLDRGFDEFFGMQSGSIFIEPSAEGVENWNPQPISETRQRPIFRGREVVEETEYLTEVLTREALDFIDRHHEEPFFLYLAHYTPHVPLQATAKYLDRYRHIEDQKTRIFAAMVSSLDDSVGEVMARLREHGLEEDTMIVFLSDNGCALYVDGACTNGPLRGGKRWFFEGGIRVPFLLSWPAGVEPGQVYEPAVSSLDLLPTFAAAGGAPLPEKPLDGVDLLPYLRGEVDGVPHETLFWRAGPNRAVRRGDWKLWQVNRASEEQVASLPLLGALFPAWEAPHGSPLGQLNRLHDLENDLGERIPLAGDEQAVLDELRRALDAWEGELVEPRWWSNRGTAGMVDDEAIELIF